MKPPVALDPRTRAAPGPDAGQRALLADAGFILKPDFDRPAGKLRRDAARASPAKFYGMARPSFRRGRLAGGSKGGMGMKIAVLGVDLGKNVCSVVGLDASGAVVMRGEAGERR